MPRMMVDVPDELAERIRRGSEEFGLDGPHSAARILRILIERGARAIDDDRLEHERRATYEAWADDQDALHDAERNLERLKSQGRL